MHRNGLSMPRGHEQHQLADLAIGDLLEMCLNILEVGPVPSEIRGNLVQPRRKAGGSGRGLFAAEHLTPRLLEQGVTQGEGLGGSRHGLTKTRFKDERRVFAAWIGYVQYSMRAFRATVTKSHTKGCTLCAGRAYHRLCRSLTVARAGGHVPAYSCSHAARTVA